jgi:hypothetical protein
MAADPAEDSPADAPVVRHALVREGQQPPGVGDGVR